MADDGSIVAVVGGQVDVEPHMVAVLQSQGFTMAGADTLITDSANPVPDATVTE